MVRQRNADLIISDRPNTIIQEKTGKFTYKWYVINIKYHNFTKQNYCI